MELHKVDGRTLGLDGKWTAALGSHFDPNDVLTIWNSINWKEGILNFD